MKQWLVLTQKTKILLLWNSTAWYARLFCESLYNLSVDTDNANHALNQQIGKDKKPRWFAFKVILIFERDFVACAQCKEESAKREVRMQSLFSFNRYLLVLQVRLDRGFKNDMQILSITCSLCDWTGLLNGYEVWWLEICGTSLGFVIRNRDWYQQTKKWSGPRSTNKI